MAALNFAVLPKIPQGENRIEVDFEAGTSNTLWVTMAADPKGGRHNFSLPLLNGLHDLIAAVKSDGVTWRHQGQARPVHYAVLKSGHPDYFSLGGDLEHFRACIGRRDKLSLRQYSKLSLDIMYQWATALNESATTIALVQGRALGGGFETALGADFLIAEEHSEFGFPEIMFGLFPCSGGMSLLARRIGVHAAERMMSDSRIYSAPELKEMGVVDVVCPKGDGVLATENFIANHVKRRIPRLMLQRSRHRIAPLDYQELLTVVDEWTEAAMGLTAEELRVMEMLIRMQEGR